MDDVLFEVIDATGGGCCRLRIDETIEAASPNFVALTGVAEVIGRAPSEIIGGLPAVAELPGGVEDIVVRTVGVDGIGRELAVARVFTADGSVLVLVDRSGEARRRRNEARLGRQIDDLEAQLAAREREPRRPRIRSMAELAERLDEAVMRARRYRHHVTLVIIRIAHDGPLDDKARALGETVVGCVRGVDDLGRVTDDHWILLLPHTDLAGGEVVGKRVLARLAPLEIGTIGVAVAQVGPEEPGSAAVERADQVCVQALEGGGGLLLAVALL